MVIKEGDTVKVHYRGTLNDGTEFDSSAGREPLEFCMGQGQLIPGFENAVLGRNTGDKVNVNIPAAEAYGEHDPQHILPVSLEHFPEDMELAIDMPLQLQTESGMLIEAVVVEITDTHAMLDANHPLAGQDLNFEIEVIEVS